MTTAAELARLNHDCRSVALDPDELRRQLAAAGLDGSPGAHLRPEHESLFANAAVFVGRGDVERMAVVVRAVEAAVRAPAYRELAFSRAPDVARRAPGAAGVLFGYDFHLADAGPQLIEINTNAGGVLLNVALARAQRACCDEARGRLAPPFDLEGAERAVLSMFQSDWRRARGAAPLRRAVVVDDDPQAQFLYPEFVLFRELFARAGLDAQIAAAQDLVWRGGRLELGGAPVDLVYNRLTDFYLEAPEHAALRAAYVADAVVVTPHPHAHALYANKHNLVALSDADFLSRASVNAAAIEVLAASVPKTVSVAGRDAEALWRERKRWFFKPGAGFGSKAAYRGDKLTRGTFAAILAGDYIAQQIVPPSERLVEVAGVPVPLKVDVRNFVYDGGVQLVAARLYHGQTTNFRTPGGGFAVVFADRGEGGPG